MAEKSDKCHTIRKRGQPQDTSYVTRKESARMVEFLFPDQDSEQQGMETPMPATTEESSDNYEICRERRSSDVAIIGISGRFAGSANLSTFWSHLQAGESCIEEIQRESWKTSTLADPDLKTTLSRLEMRPEGGKVCGTR